MEFRKAITIGLTSEEYKTLMDASYLITQIAQNIQKYGADGITCNGGSDEKCFEERWVWDVASAVEDLADVQHMYSRDWEVEIVNED